MKHKQFTIDETEIMEAEMRVVKRLGMDSIRFFRQPKRKPLKSFKLFVRYRDGAYNAFYFKNKRQLRDAYEALSDALQSDITSRIHGHKVSSK